MRKLYLSLLLAMLAGSVCGQNVGIGVAAPQQRIDVQNNARIRGLATPAGTTRLTQSDQNGDLLMGPRLMHGRVNADGTIAGGSGGYTITKLGTGQYRVNYTTAFTAIPSVTVNGELAVGACAGVPVAALCTPTYTYGCASEHLASFVTTGGTTNINNTGTGCGAGNYTSYTGLTVTVPVNGSFNFTVTSNPAYTKGYRIWIDVDQDGTFSAAESYYVSPGSNYVGYSGTINTTGIPCGTYRLRVRNYEGGTPAAGNGCGNIATWGETEDYTLVVTGAPPVIRNAYNLASPATGSVEIRLFSPTGVATDAPFHFQVLGQ